MSASPTVTGRGSGSGWFAITLAAIIAAELLVLVWYTTTPLPNAGNIQVAATAGGESHTMAIKRWHLYALAIPYFVPGTAWSKSLLGNAIDAFRETAFLYQRVPLLLAGLLIATAGLGLGLILIRALRADRWLNRAERLVLGFGLGLNTVASLTLLAGRLGLLSPWPVRITLAGLALVGLTSEFWPRKTSANLAKSTHVLSRGQWVVLTLVAAPFLLIMALGSFQPSVDFDALEYHLQGPKEWFLQGRIGFLPHNVYTSMPFSIEMLHLLGMEVLNDWWSGALVGQFLIMLHAPMATLALILVGTRIGSPRVALVAALVYISTPWVYRLCVFAYVEGPLAYYHAALLLAAERAWTLSGLSGSITNQTRVTEPGSADGATNTLGLWAIVGWLTGGAVACKYPALISAGIPFTLLATLTCFKAKRPAILPAILAGMAVAIGPWLIKNTLDHGNPVYPLGDSVFHGHPWSPAREAQWKKAHGPRAIGMPELMDSASEVAGRNDWQSPLYLALAPLAFLRGERRRIAWLLAGFSLYIFATWWLFTHRLDRFWLPILPSLALLAGLGADWSCRQGWNFVLGATLGLGLLLNFVFDTSELAAYNQWTNDLTELEREAPALANQGLAWLDTVLPANSQTLLVGPAGVFHMKHRILYNTVFDDDRLEALAANRQPSEVREALKQQGITHLYVDWAEIHRHRKPGGYGFTDFEQPELFENWVKAGILTRIPVPAPLSRKDFYEVR